MSFLFGGAGQNRPSSAEKIMAAETEVEMLSDMFNRLVESCTKKCIPTDYREGDLNKGESVCLDRCVAKMFEVNMKVGEKMQEVSGTRAAAAGAGGMGGFGA